jgi:hypothetical protein
MSEQVVAVLCYADGQPHKFDLVAPHLSRAGIEPVIINLAQISGRPSLEHIGGHSRVVVKTGAGRTVLDPIAVFYSPGDARQRELALKRVLSTRVPAAQVDGSWRAVQAHADTLEGEFFDALWASRPDAVLACHKPRQLRIAEAVARDLPGFEVPETLQTADGESAREFLRRGGRHIMKPPTKVVFREPDGREAALCTTEVAADDALDWGALAAGPMIFQQLVDGIDIRVTVVGGAAFPAQIVPEGDPAAPHVRDYRAGPYRFERHTIPDHIAHALVRLVRELNLAHGEIDLILDAGGTYWFLEVNPDGAWGGVELQTGLPISRAFADLLLSARHAHR